MSGPLPCVCLDPSPLGMRPSPPTPCVCVPPLFLNNPTIQKPGSGKITAGGSYQPLKFSSHIIPPPFVHIANTWQHPSQGYDSRMIPLDGRLSLLKDNI